MQTRATLDHSGTENYSIERAYDTLQNWENAQDGNLVGELRREVGVAYNDADFDELVVFSGATTDAARFMWLTVAPVDRHSGVAGSGAVVRPSVPGDVFVVQSDYTRVEWFEVTGWPGASNDAFRIRADHTLYRHLIVHDGGDGASDGFRMLEGTGNWTARIENTIAYNMGRACYNANNDTGSFDLVLILENVTAYNCGTGGNFAAGGVNACQGASNTTTVHARNVLAVGNLDGEGDADADFNINNLGSGCTATPSWGISDFNVSTDLTAPGPDSVTLVAAGGEFVSAVDLHLKSGAQAIDKGEPSLSFFDDIDDFSRLGLAWDVGADEFMATTAVALTSFRATPGDREVVIEWATGSELDNLGFHVYRASTAAGPFQRVTERAIPGLGSSPVGARYRYRDSGLVNGLTYFYEIEDVETTGATTRHGPVFATPSPSDDEPDERDEREASGGGELIYGDPDAGGWSIRRAGSGRLSIELTIGGFVGRLSEEGILYLAVPGLTTEDGLPVRRAWIDAIEGRGVEIVSVRAEDVSRFQGLRPDVNGPMELVASPEGTVGLRRTPGRTRRGSRGAVEDSWARIRSVGYQGAQKRALVELSPFRWDEESGELLMARRLVVTLSFRKVDPSEKAARRRRGRGEHEVVARLATGEPGLYGLRYEDLFGARARPSLPVTKLRLTRQGQPVAYRLVPHRDAFRPGSTLYFVSEGARLNPYGNEAVYELELGEPGLLMEDAPVNTGRDPVSYLWHRLEREENRYYQAGLLDAPDLWLWDLLFAPETKPFPFSISGLASTTEEGQLRVWLQGASDLPADPDHHVRLFVNGQLVAELSWDGKQDRPVTAPLTAGVLHEGENLLEIENVGDTQAAYSMVLLDRFEVDYPRLPADSVERLSGRSPWTGDLLLPGFPEGTVCHRCDGRSATMGVSAGAPRGRDPDSRRTGAPIRRGGSRARAPAGGTGGPRELSGEFDAADRLPRGGAPCVSCATRAPSGEKTRGRTSHRSRRHRRGLRRVRTRGVNTGISEGVPATRLSPSARARGTLRSARGRWQLRLQGLPRDRGREPDTAVDGKDVVPLDSVGSWIRRDQRRRRAPGFRDRTPACRQRGRRRCHGSQDPRLGGRWRQTRCFRRFHR